MSIQTIKNMPVTRVKTGDTVFDTWPDGPEGHVSKATTSGADVVLTVSGIEYYAPRTMRVSIKRWD
jgi:hypothetical protein